VQCNWSSVAYVENRQADAKHFSILAVFAVKHSPNEMTTPYLGNI